MKNLGSGIKSIVGVGSNLTSYSLNIKLVSRLVLWFVASLTILLVFFPEFWGWLGDVLAPEWMFGERHVSPWGVLALCLVWLWLMRKKIWSGMNENVEPKDRSSKANFVFYALSSTLGVGVIVGAVLMPFPQDFLAFQILLASLGVFVILFGRGAQIPSILLAIYGFAISFPLMIERFAEVAYSRMSIVPLTGLITALGYPLESQGQLIHFTTSAGEPISLVITTACAGPATMGVFLCLFALMMLDRRLPAKKAAWVFLFGAIGTWLQNFIRLVILVIAGYYWGEEAIWTAHFWATYILFPLWYLLFVYIYFRQAGSFREIRRKFRGAEVEIKQVK